MFGRNHPFGRALRQVGPITRGLTVSMLAASLALSVLYRTQGLTGMPWAFDRRAIASGEVWRLLTFFWVKTQSPLGLIVALVLTWLIMGQLEARFGSTKAFALFVTSSVGTALLAMPLGALCQIVMPFYDVGVLEGPDAAIDAWIAALATQAPHAQMLLGFVLPISASTLVFGLIGLDVITGLMTGASNLGATLAALCMGWLLFTGHLRPQTIWERLVLGRKKRRRRGLWVVRPTGRTDLN